MSNGNFPHLIHNLYINQAGHQIRENFQTECLRGIDASINYLGRLSSDGLVPRVFYTKGSSSVQHLNLFDRGDKDYCIEPFPESSEDD